MLLLFHPFFILTNFYPSLAFSLVFFCSSFWELSVLNHLDLFYQQVSEIRHDIEKPQILSGSCCAFGVIEAETALRDVVTMLVITREFLSCFLFFKI